MDIFKKENIDLIKVFIPFGGAILIFLGFIKLQMYYYHFNINIIRYIDLGDLIISILGVLYYLLIYILLMTVNYFLHARNINLPPNKKSFESIINIKSFLKRIIAYIIHLRQIEILLITVTIFCILSDVIFGNGYHVSSFISTFILVICFFIINFEIKREMYLRPVSRNSFLFVLYSAYIFFFWILSSEITNYEIIKVKKELLYSDVSVQFKNQLIQSSDTYYYIGNTRNYIFFYNSVDERSDVYPIQDVVKIGM